MRSRLLSATLLACAAAALSCSLGSLSGFTGGEDEDAAAGGDAAVEGAPDPAGDAGPDATEVPRDGWQYRKSLTIEPASVSSATDLTGFPLLVRMTDPDLRTIENGGKAATGLDIAFFAADGVTPLAHEIERYAPDTGELIAWVELPVLSATAGAKLFLTFGNATVTTPLDDRTRVWGAGYAGVWHLNDAKWIDSAGANHGTEVGPAAPVPAGMIGAGATFGATDVYIDVGDDPGLRPSSITLSAWAQPQSVGSAPDRHPYMVHQDSWRAAGSDPRGYYLEIYRTQTDPRPTFYTGNASTSAHAFATTNVVNGTWYYVVGTRDEVSGVTRIYVNGLQEGSATMTGPLAYLSNTVRLGGVGTQSWNGLLDEVRISSVARSSGWIRTEYENQRSPQTFVKVGALQTLPP